MSAVRVSVIIPTHNRHEQLPVTLAALYDQDLPRQEYEILVVDDGSEPPVELAPPRNGVNQRILRTSGVERSAARNTGAAAAIGEVLVFIDDDIVVGSYFLRAHLQAHEEWPEALVTGRIRLPAEERRRPFVRFRQRLEEQGVPRVRGRAASAHFCAAGNLSVPAAVFRRLGGFDAGLSSSEDQDLALRHAAAGGSVAFLPEAEGIHRDRALDIRSYCRRAEWGSAAMVPFCRRYPSLPENVARARINGPARCTPGDLGADVRKWLKSFLGLPPLTAGLFLGCGLVERCCPHSRVLDRLYRLLLGIHIQRGYRRGLREHPARSPRPLPGARPVVMESSVR